MTATIPDQAELLEAHERLTGQVTTLTTERDQARAQVGTLTAERDALAEERDRLKATITERDTALATANTERDQAIKAKADAEKASADAAAKMADFEKAVAAEVTKRGVGNTPVPPPKAQDNLPEPSTAVGKVLRRLGFTTLAEYKAAKGLQ